MTASDSSAGSGTETGSWGRRIGALFLDWFAASLVVFAITGEWGGSSDPLAPLYPIGVFVLQKTVLTFLLGGSFGQLILGLRVVRRSAAVPISPLRALARTVLVALVVPPLIFRPDGRGLHDMAVDTQTIRYPIRTAD